jgi:Arc/MetJ family transcription regulator
MSRTLIDIDDELLEKAKKATGMKKKVEVVNFALDSLIKQKNIEKILELKGKIHWEGDLGEMRKDRIDTCR